MHLLVKKLDPAAIVPTQAHPHEDLGYDIYALRDVFLKPGQQAVVPTGIAAIFAETPSGWSETQVPGTIGPSGGWYNRSRRYGLILKDRSGMAAKHGLHTLAGVIDAGYRGEIRAIMVLLGLPAHRHYTSDEDPSGYWVRKGDKIAQLVPIPVYAATITEVQDLPGAARGENGFGSSGF